MESIFFTGWDSIIRTLLIGVLAYFALVLMLRISGKRTLSQMKEFDFIVTVALGSTLATVLLNKNVALLDGIVALGLLILLQYILAAASVRSPAIANIISSRPALIFFKGEFMEEALKKERVTGKEVRSILRSQGVADLEDAEAIVMESNGQFSVLKKGSLANPESSLFNVKKEG